MSLIDEALRRAQEESARRGEGKGTQRWVAGPPPRRRMGPGLVAAIVAAGLVGGLALGAWLFRGRSGSPAGVGEEVEGVVKSAAAGETLFSPQAELAEALEARDSVQGPGEEASTGAGGDGGAGQAASPVEAEDAGAEGAVPPAAPRELSSPARAGGQAPGSQPPEPSQPSALPGSVEPAPPAVAASSTQAAPPAAAEPSPAPQADAAAAAPPPTADEAEPAEERTFRRIAQLPDGTTLSLNGIAFSEERPMALLNGQVLAVGETVAGYRVAEILPDRVRLERQGAAVVLRLK